MATEEEFVLKSSVFLNDKEGELAFTGDCLQWSIKKKPQSLRQIKCDNILNFSLSKMNKDVNVSIIFINAQSNGIWKQEETKFLCQMEDADISKWRDTLEAAMEGVRQKRPRRLLIFINPKSGDGKSASVYDKKVAPLFALANIETDVHVTQHENHAAEILESYNLDSIDGIVTSGGDGTVSIVLGAYYRRYCRDVELDVDNPDTALIPPPLPLGVLPTGSSQLMIQACTLGVKDLTTAALRIIHGRTFKQNCLTAHHNGKFLGLCNLFAGYIMTGDMHFLANQYRHLGRHLKYVVSSFKALKSFRTASLKICYKTRNGDSETKCVDSKFLLVQIPEYLQDRDVISWKTDAMRLIIANENFARRTLLSHSKMLFGCAEEIEAAPNVEYVDCSECIVEVTSQVDEYISLDGEPHKLEPGRTVILKFHENFVTLFGAEECEHKLNIGW